MGWNFLPQLAIAIVTALVAVALAPKPRARKNENQVTRIGVDHDLERVYGTRRLGLIVTDAKTSTKTKSPDDLTGISDVIRSNVTDKGKDEHNWGIKPGTLVVQGPLCVSGRLNAAFQSKAADDLNPKINEKNYANKSLLTSNRFSKGGGFELHLKGGTRPPLSTFFSLGKTTDTFEQQVYATAHYYLSLKRELVYAGIPDLTLDVESNLLFDPRAADTVGTPSTWTGRADNPVLQLLDYLLDDDFGAGVSVNDIDLTYWETAADIADTPSGVIVTTNYNERYLDGGHETYKVVTEVKSQTVGYLLESNLTLSTERTIGENLEELLAACRGAVLFKTRSGKWAIQMDFLHENDLTQTFTGETGTGPFDMDWPTSNCRVYKNSGLLTSGVDYSIVTNNTQTTVTTNGVPGTPSGTDPDGTVGITFTVALIAGDTIDIDFSYDVSANPNGIPAAETQFHIVDDPADIGRDYNASDDVNGVDLIRVIDPDKSELSLVSLDDRVNQCIVKFPDSLTKYTQNQIVWPEVGSATHTAFLTEDHDKKLIKEVSINSITTAEKALDYAEWVVRTSRSANVVTLQLDSFGLQLDPNDTVLISSPRLNINAEKWRCVKISPKADATVTAYFKPYEAEDYSYAVEAFSQSDDELDERIYGPVENVSFSSTIVSGTYGSGVLSWTAPTNGVTSDYRVHIADALVWDVATTYALNDIVYFEEEFYQANTGTTGGADPDVNSDWDEIDDGGMWKLVHDGAATSANIRRMQAEGDYVFKIVPFTPLRGEGVPYYHEQNIDRFSFDYETDLASTPGDGINRINPRYAGNWYHEDERLPIHYVSTIDYVTITEPTGITGTPSSGYYGTHTMKINTQDTLNVDGIVYFGSATNDYNMSLDPNSYWFWRAKAWANVASTDVQVRIRTNDGSFHTPVGSNTFTIPNNTAWHDWTAEFDLTANSSPRAVIRVDLDETPDATNPNYTLYLDGIMLEKKVGDATAARDWLPALGKGGQVLPNEIVSGSLHSQISQDDSGGIARALAKGVQTGFAEHNDVITFDQEWDSPPEIVWLAGGIINDSSSTVGNDAYIVANAINVTKTSFKAQLLLRDPASSPTARTDTTSTSIGGNIYEIKKDQTAEAWNDTYTLTFTGRVQNGSLVNDNEPGGGSWYQAGTAVYGIYVAKVADTWVKAGTHTVSGGIAAQYRDFTESKTIIVDGIGKHASASDREFRIELESTTYGGSTLTDITKLEYETVGTAPTDITLTPNNSVPYMVIG